MGRWLGVLLIATAAVAWVASCAQAQIPITPAVPATPTTPAKPETPTPPATPKYPTYRSPAQPDPLAIAMNDPAIDHAEFAAFIETLWPDALAKSISRATFDAALAAIMPDPSVLALAEKQPEHDRAIWEYLALLVSDERADAGRAKLAELAPTLDAIEQAYGVDRSIVVAIWGIESAYGTAMGSRSVIQSLATLAWKGGNRAAFGRRELLAALQILERRDIDPAAMTGSWAGAMGHTQFIPSTFNAHAVDFDRDGRRDIWRTIPDALASTANYLKASGWRTQEPWGFEVVLPGGFDLAITETGEKSLAQWRQIGLQRSDTVLAMPDSSIKATLLLPAGIRGPAFLVTANFRAILKYNNAVSYAIGVGMLADRIKGAGRLNVAWPQDERPLLRAEREELQKLLVARGFVSGDIDGIIGSQTRAALKGWQRAKGLPPDGFPSPRYLDMLRSETKS